MQTVVGANRAEFLRIAEAVAREKSIDKQIVLSAMEDAIQKAAWLRYGSENEIKVSINPQTGEIEVLRILEVVEEVQDASRQIPLKLVQKDNSSAKVGDKISEVLPAFDLGRVAAQSAKNVIVHRVREAERDRQYEEYKNRVGDVVNGTVKRLEHGDIVLDLGHAEGIIRRQDGLPGENFSYGDRIRAYIYDVRRESRGAQIFLSRGHPQFMVKLFMQGVPEIYDGIVQIKSVARDPGSRAKIAVLSKDSTIDPVGACVGMRGSRVQAVVNELQGEKIDIIVWSDDPASFIVNALAPAEVVKVVMDENTRRIEVVVPNDQLSRAIGRRGQNVRLASQLTGWDIDILTETEESERRQKEFAERTATFVKALDVDEMIGQLLASEGFASIEEIAYVPVEEIASIEGFDEDTAREIQLRAGANLERQEEELSEKCKSMNIEAALAEIPGISRAILVRLGENGIKTMDDLAGCVPDDLVGWVEKTGREQKRYEGFLSGLPLNRKQAESVILEARQRVGWIQNSRPEGE